MSDKTFLTFYLVWTPTTGYTKFKHENYSSAKNEAERLALEHPNQEFYILQTCERCKVKNIEWEKSDPLPF